jgi:hypothetical protein
MLVAMLTSSGCSGIFTPTIEPHPDAPIWITNTFAGFVKGAVYDKERNVMVPCGWFWIGRFDGYTLHKFNWQKRIDADNVPPEKQTK